MYSILFYLVVTNGLIEMWMLLGYMRPKNHIKSSTVNLVIMGTLGFTTPFIITLLMVVHEFNHMDAVTDNISLIAGYIIALCVGWLFIIYEKVRETKGSKRIIAMPK